jgi:hypothetical protein
MSSAELLDLIEYLPHVSAYQTARRRGDWSVDQYIQARIGEEMAYARADGSGYMPEVEIFRSPMQQHMAAAVEMWKLNTHQRNVGELTRKRKGGVAE